MQMKLWSAGIVGFALGSLLTAGFGTAFGLAGFAIPVVLGLFIAGILVALVR